MLGALATYLVLLYADAHPTYAYHANDAWVNPLIVHERADSLVGRLIDNVGAFPKSDAGPIGEHGKIGFRDLDQQLFRVASYRLGTVTIGRTHRNILEALQDDDPTYGADVEVMVLFEDGEEADFKVTVWTYGLFTGFSAGGQPWIAGRIERLGTPASIGKGAAILQVTGLTVLYQELSLLPCAITAASS